ncbi:MAG: RcnB family protein [Parvibaculum sp.]
MLEKVIAMKRLMKSRISRSTLWRSLRSGVGILALSTCTLAVSPALADQNNWNRNQQNQQQRQPQQRPDQRQIQQQQHIQQNQRYDWRRYQPGHYPPQWQTYRRSFNPQPYYGNVVAPNRYRLQRYVGPHGWYYRRWVYGQYLPAIYWTRNYWLSSYWQFGLFNPPYGYVWVRYYNDALLISVENGHILRVVYSAFYY